MKSTMRTFVLGVPILLGACASGGGSPPAAAPISPPPPTFRPALPTALSGSIVSAVVTGGGTGLFTSVSVPTQSSSGISMDAGTAAPGDENYRIQFESGGARFDRDVSTASGVAGADGFWTTRTWSESGTSVDLFDLTFEGGQHFDYLVPFRIDTGGAVHYGIYGTRSGALPGTLPERYVYADGIARFRGAGVGTFADAANRTFRSTSSINIEVNLTSNEVWGAWSDTRFRAENPAPEVGQPTNAPNSAALDFQFRGPLNRNAMTFTATGTTNSSSNAFGPLTGPVSGFFYGAPGSAPDELGFTFALANAAGTVKYWGTGAGEHDLAPRPWLTPMTTVTMGRGPSVSIAATNIGLFGARGPGSGIGGSNLLNVSSNVWASFSPGATMDFKNDNWTLHYDEGGYAIDGTATFSTDPNYANANTRFESFLIYPGNPASSRHHVANEAIGFDLGPSLAGALDNVFLISVEGDIFEKNQTTTYVVFGTQTAAADMPTTGSAKFRGATRGVYLDAQGQYFKTNGKLAMDANFGTGAVTGRASEFNKSGEGYCLCQSADVLDFSFAGSIIAGKSTFSATAQSAAGGVGLTGRVEGAFYGAPGVAPDEAGIAYQLGQPGGVFMAGAGLLVKD